MSTMKNGSAMGNHRNTQPEQDWRLTLEYAQVNENFRTLSDIRFKLLAFVPTLAGAAVFLLSRFLDVQADEPSEYAVFWEIALLGFLATLGITLYDQRNTQLYDQLIVRASFLEGIACMSPNSRAKKYEQIVESDMAVRRKNGEEPKPRIIDFDLTKGAQFRERPKRGRRLFGTIVIGHDNGLALIYGPVLGAWFFPIVYAALGALGFGKSWANGSALVVSAALIIVFTGHLLWLDYVQHEENVHMDVVFKKTSVSGLTFPPD